MCCLSYVDSEGDGGKGDQPYVCTATLVAIGSIQYSTFDDQLLSFYTSKIVVPDHHNRDLSNTQLIINSFFIEGLNSVTVKSEIKPKTGHRLS